jgi:cytochrome b561
MLRNSSERWGALSQALHWLIVLLILAQGTIGLLMDDMRNGPDKIEVYAQHKSIGLSILALAVLRLGWRLVAGCPARHAGSDTLPAPATPCCMSCCWRCRLAAGC